MTQTPGPGWFPDPDGSRRMRWWDGQQWTSSTSQAPDVQGIGHSSPPSDPSRPSGQPAVNKGQWNRSVLLVCGAVVAAMAAIGLLVNFFSPSDGDSGSNTTSVAQGPSALELSRQDRSTYETLDERTFSVLLRDPEADKGRKVLLYGEVSQFDTITGPELFMAHVSSGPSESGHNDNVFVRLRDAAIAKDVVEGDLVTVYAEIDGVQTYDNKLGQETQAAVVWANVVDVTGRR